MLASPRDNRASAPPPPAAAPPLRDMRESFARRLARSRMGSGACACVGKRARVCNTGRRWPFSYKLVVQSHPPKTHQTATEHAKTSARASRPTPSRLRQRLEVAAIVQLLVGPHIAHRHAVLGQGAGLVAVGLGGFWGTGMGMFGR